MTDLTTQKFAAMCAYIASNAAKWAGDIQSTGGDLSHDELIRQVAQFGDEISGRLNRLCELAGVEDIRERRLASVTAPDNGTVEEVLQAILLCANAWVPEARIIGNVRAGDIARAVSVTLAEREQHVPRSPPADVTESGASKKLALWFFRDLSDEQRGKLFLLFRMGDAAGAPNHGYQAMAFASVLRLIATGVSSD